MTNLPISINSTPAKAGSGKQSASAETVQAGSSEFGTMLARQVTDADKAASPPTKQSDASMSKKVTKQDNTEPAPPSEDASALPAEMLAALVPQPTPPFATREIADQQAESAIQPDATLQPAPLLPIAVAPVATNFSAMTDQNTLTPLATQNATHVSGNMQQPAPETTLPKYAGTMSEGKGFADSIKTAVAKELNSNSVLSARPSGISESPLTPQQAAIFPMLQGTTAAPSPLAIHTPLSQPAWGEEFSQQVTWMAGQRNQSAELHLNPPHLGPLDVVLKMNGDQASAIFTSPHAAVRDAIEQALPQLREMLADSGIMLGNASVNDQATHKNQDTPSRKSSSAKAETGTEITATTGTLSSFQRSHQGMVDTFA